ncbi:MULTISPECIES: protein CreA [Providencia]|uniref:Catabolite regulation protein CreA n=1 Tax=Providencia rettgeri TaxID=587 RepID=A0A264VT10_PRORE|nr:MULTISPECIES: protein CreA [Providencia]MBN7841425.1 protein CreA [Providencia rettgeri]MBN7853444.1 protein CreA [Providencia rettgeri]MBN7862573.1 protein CreA [Providencia rettgeri]MBN7872487.1 protein CreA [Providencia rettgeri]MBN7895190.1 protein CreA [Providencia rettgeri]
MRCSRLKNIILAALLSVLPSITFAEEIGSVDTVFKIFGPDHKIVVEAFDDPDVDNVTCYLSRSKTGGIKGGLGLAEDTSDAAISCQQVGPIELNDRVKRKPTKGQVVFQKRTSLVFKKLQVVRFYDPKRNALIYLTYSDKMIDGSPKNALSAVPIMPW